MHLHQLTREALRLLQAPAGRGDPDAPPGGPVSPSAGTMSSPRDAPGPAGSAGRQPSAGPDRRKGMAWPSGPSVQVSVAPAGLGGALSTVTIQAQQCLEGMWSVSRVNSFLPPTCLAEAAVAAVAVADTVRDGPPMAGPDGVSKVWGRGGACTSALVTPAPGASAGGSTGPSSAAASFFIRAAQKLSLASKRKKHHPPPAPAARGTSTYPTDFSGVLQLWPPPAPPCLLRAASKTKDNPGSFGKVKVMLRIWPAQGVQRSAESTSYLKVDPRKKQVTLYDPAAGPPGSAGLRRAGTAAVPKMFAFDAIFPQDSEQAEVCSGTVADVLQSVVSGADGCIFSFGHMSLGKGSLSLSPICIVAVPGPCAWVVEEGGFRCGHVGGVSWGGSRSFPGWEAEGLPWTRGPRDKAKRTPEQGSHSSRPGCPAHAPRAPRHITSHHFLQPCHRKSPSLLLPPGRCSSGPQPPTPRRSQAGPLSLLALRDHSLTMLLRESLATAGCRTTMIAHVSDAPAHHAETLSTVQLAARIHRLRRKKAKYASSSSGGESSCEEGRARRPPHLRPFHPRTVALDPDRPVPGLPGDPDYSSSSEQSCDTVIYVGPSGAALSDRELTDNEGPPDFVPIIPALSRRRPSEGPRDADHFRCSTFAELQERLECIDGSEGPWGPPGGTGGAQASPARGSKKLSPPEAASPRKALGPPMAASTPRGSPGPDTHWSVPEPSRASAQSDQRKDNSTWPEPPAPDLATGDGGRRPLPSPAPPPPQQPEACEAPADPGGGGTSSMVRTPPVGMSGQAGQPPPSPDVACSCPSTRSRCLERGLLTTTVTLQQPVELNGEDELVFTVVEELPLGGLAGATRPSSLASFGSGCSLQALASGSRPVSIISSVNDEFDAYTSQAPEGPCGSAGALEGTAWAGSSSGQSISSWLSEVSVCTANSSSPTPGPPFSPDFPAGSGPADTSPLSSVPEESSCRSSERGGPVCPGPAHSPHPREATAAALARSVREPWDASPRGAATAQTIHSSLPRKPRTTSLASRAGCTRPGRSPPGPGGPLEDPWLLRADDCDMLQLASAVGASSPTLGISRMPEAQAVLVGDQRVVDGYEVAARGGRKPEAVARIPPLRRGATTLGVTTPAVSCGDTLTEAICSGSLKASPSGKRSLALKGGFFPRPSGAVPPTPPVRKSSLEQNCGGSAPPQALGLPRAGAAAVFRGEEESRPSGRVDHSVPRATSSLKARAAKMEAVHRSAGHASLERSEGLAHGSSKVREAPGRPPRAVPRLGVPPTSPTPGPVPACRGSPAKGMGAPKPPTGGAKGRSLMASGTPGGPVMGPRMAPRAAPGLGAKAGRGTIMGTKQALRAAHSRVHELAAMGPGSATRVVWPVRGWRVARGRLAVWLLLWAVVWLFGWQRAGAGPWSLLTSAWLWLSLPGLQRRRLIPAPLPDAAALGRKPSLPGQWVDLPPLAGALKEPFEIKVYEIDDVQRLQRHRPPPREDPAQGPMCVSSKLRLAERRQQRLREVQAKRAHLCEELAETQGRLMVEPGRWLEQFEVDPELEPESAEYLVALERATAALEQCVNLCKAHVMMVTCFDISVATAAAVPGPQEVDV
uniref:Kinesin family member 26A n=1 Tax=Marmota marmota marmota TaxID=9994 RepID=A0A8C5YXC2_MARMA